MGTKRNKVFEFILKPKSRFIALSKKMKLLESEEVRWVKEHLRTKPEPKQGDKVDGATKDEVPVTAFGEIEFKCATRRTKSKFIQVSNESLPQKIFELMTKIWKVDKPQILISVTGGAKFCNLNPKLKEMFVNGLRKMSQTPRCWVITGGTNTGVMKHVGDALQGQAKTLIGIATWGIVSNNEVLVRSDKLPLGGKFPYKVESSLVPKKACLDHNHTHFLLIHDGTEGEFEREIPFRSEFEKYIMEECSEESVPSVMLVLEGGSGTIETVYGACQRCIPVVLIKGSGRAADLLAYACEELRGDFIKNSEMVHPELMSKIKENFPDLKSNDVNIAEKKYKDLYEKIRLCMENKEYITAFEISEHSDLDKAVLLAVLKGQTKPGFQLQLTLLWDRPDLASNHILWKFSELTEEDLQNAVIMALALNRVDFLELLLHYCVSVKAILTQPVLGFLYGYASYKYQSPIKEMVRDVDYCKYEETKYSDTVKTLCSYTGQKLDKCCIKLSKIKDIIRRLCGRLMAKGDEDFIQTLDYSEGEFQYQYGVLFFWALLSNMHEMARFLWHMEEEGIAKAIIAAEINNELAAQADQRGMAEELRKTFIKNSQDFKDLAIKVLNGCYSTNEKQTEAMITRELTQFPGHTCLSLANCSGQEEFVAHSSVQQLLNDAWTGVLKSREVSTFSLLLAIIFPPSICRFKFRNKTELKHMVHVEDDFDGEEEELTNIKTNESNIDAVEEIKKGSHSKTKLTGKDWKSYHSFQNKDELEESEEENQEMNWFLKGIEFYFKIPAIKFVTSMISYFIFLGLFAYVAMLEKRGSNPEVPEIILIVFVISFTFEEINQVCQSHAVGLLNKLRRYFYSIWNIMDVVAFSLFFVGLGLRLNPTTVEYGHLLYGIDSWIWILRLLRVFYAHRKLGPYVVMIGKMFKDMLYFITILLVFLVAYGVATNAILKPRKGNWSMLTDIFWHSYFNIYGELFVDDPDKDTTSFGTPKINNYAEPVAWVFLALYLLVANVLLLNLLIAIFGNTFEEVQKKSDQVWKYERYDLVIEYHNRPGLVPPFMILAHVWSMVTYIYRRFYKKKTEQIRNELQTTLSESEKAVIMEFEMDCIANMLRDKFSNPVKE